MDTILLGPAGGDGGHPFSHYERPGGARITAIHIFADWVIVGLQLEYVNGDGSPGSLSRVGGAGGQPHVFTLDDGEYLTGISGRSGWFVDSLRFHTNRRVSPLYGGPGGERDFLFIAPDAYEVAGFFGRGDWFIDGLGVAARPRLQVDESRVAPGKDDSLDEKWFVLPEGDDGDVVTTAVKRRVLTSSEDLAQLEREALDEAAEEYSGGTETPDLAFYTQIIDDVDSHGDVAVVLAVAGAAGTIKQMGDARDEVAIMAVNEIEDDDDLMMLEDEAVEEAVDRFQELIGEERDEVLQTVYSGTVEDQDSGIRYGAAVAIIADTVERAPSRTAAIVERTPHAPRPKDLALVNGIGPRIAELLIAHGVLDLADLAETSQERLQAILTAGGKRFRLADPAQWPAEARELAAAQGEE